MTRENGVTYRIKDLAEDERPRERLASIGAEFLSKPSCWRYYCV